MTEINLAKIIVLTFVFLMIEGIMIYLREDTRRKKNQPGLRFKNFWITIFVLCPVLVLLGLVLEISLFWQTGIAGSALIAILYPYLT